MNLQQRINLLTALGQYLSQQPDEWAPAAKLAERENGWFTQEFIRLSIDNITRHFLDAGKLQALAASYRLPETQASPKLVGLVTAGNIPLVGFHDWLCIFLTGHNCLLKQSSKDRALMNHLLQKMVQWEPSVAGQTRQAEMLKGCDAYIATGSNNSARYFDYYFSKYPSVIRRNRTSVAVLDGQETVADFDQLADDVHLYFGLGCRNVTQVLVPRGFDFVPMLETFRKYAAFADHNKYKNNYDYQLALLMLNKRYYMTNGSLLLVENDSAFSPVSQLNYRYYDSKEQTLAELRESTDIQCIVGHQLIAFGQTQSPGLTDFADGVDTLRFLAGL
ncbi:MAG: acyl-CoA reductase [Bacteroidetes bacterium]|nr:acyl-CoA reductase [Bacteroidota bacterium]